MHVQGVPEEKYEGSRHEGRDEGDRVPMTGIDRREEGRDGRGNRGKHDEAE